MYSGYHKTDNQASIRTSGLPWPLHITTNYTCVYIILVHSIPYSVLFISQDVYLYAVLCFVNLIPSLCLSLGLSCNLIIFIPSASGINFFPILQMFKPLHFLIHLFLKTASFLTFLQLLSFHSFHIPSFKASHIASQSCQNKEILTVEN